MVRRFFRSCLVGLLVGLLVCSPAAAASTTGSQIMMTPAADDAGIMPMSLVNNTYNISISALLYDAYSFDFVDHVSGSASASVAYSPGIKLYSDRIYASSSIVHPDDTLFVCNFNIVSPSASEYLAYPGDNLSFRFIGIHPEFNVGDIYYPLSDLVFDHAEVSFWGLNGGKEYSTPFRRVNNITVSDWSYLISDLSASGYYSLITFRFFYRINNWDDILSDSLTGDGNFRQTIYWGTSWSPETAIYSSGASVGFIGGDNTGAAIDNVNQSVNQVNQSLQNMNQSIQGMIGQLQGMSAGLAQMSNAVSQMAAQLTDALDRQTQSLNAMITAQIESIRRDLGLLDDTVSSGLNNLNVSITQQTQQVTNKIDTLQQTVTNKLDTVNQSIGDLSDKTEKGFSDVKKGITELPGKIGEMLKGLIVPDSDKVSDKFTDFKELAESKLGVVYQVPEMMFDMADSIVSGAAEQKGEMTLPAFAIIMPDGQNLTVWEEYTFSIWPAGTEVIHTAVQTATSMICVILTFNALKRKYEDWLDGK